MVERDINSKNEIARALKESVKTIKALKKLHYKEEAKKAKNLQRLQELKKKKQRHFYARTVGDRYPPE